MSDQLALFDLVVPSPPDPAEAHLRQVHRDAAALAAGVPHDVHFGTSSWSFPGWRGIVYSSERSQSALAREGLREYARHPLLRTVGVDRSYYAPIPVDDLRAYADQLPDGFRCCFKAPAVVTALMLGAPGAQVDKPDFLSVDRLVGDLLQPCAVAFRQHTGPIILEFPPFPRGRALGPAEFLTRLDRFLEALPSEFEYAVELRDRRLLTPAYRTILRRHAVAHTFNYWSAMPAPGQQSAIVPPEEPPFVMMRLLLKPGTWYEDQRDRFKPFNRLIAPDEAMRADVVSVVKRALARKRRAFVLVNNKAEGSSPLTVMALAKRLTEALDG